MRSMFSQEGFNQAWVKAVCLVLNHLLAQQPNAQENLRTVQGKTLSVHVGVLGGMFVVTTQGQFADACNVGAGQSHTDADKVADTNIALPWEVVLNNFTNLAALRRQVQLQGDVDVAQTVVGVLSTLRWDAELDLSKVVGEVPAVWAVRLLKAAGSTVQQAFVGTINALREYLMYERGVLPSLAEFDDFRSRLASLRDHVARLEKRVDLLTTQHKGPGV